ncbi:LPS export ABC transporter ATP-binding protein [Candidatus Sumerlaeota bacterium]|nr:LPS export ABC transporter ATP-binding protein [Candidatus Sumerlaeota bacterium]
MTTPELIEEAKHSAPSGARGEGTLRTEGLHKQYGGRMVVCDVSFQLTQGEIVGLLGPNGAGKTTTFNMVVGIVKPLRGTILLNGLDITRLPLYKRARLGLGYLAQETSIFRKLTVEQNILAILEVLRLTRAQQRARLEELLDELGVSHLAKNLAYTLSGGERRRVEIARALAPKPQFMLLDEPFSGVDPKAVEEIQEIIHKMRDSGLGILITDHSVRETLAVTDRSYIIHEGKICVSGSPEQLVNDPDARRLYLGERFYMQLPTDDDRRRPNESGKKGN